MMMMMITWPVTTEALVQSQASPYRMYGVQSGIGTLFLQVFQFSH